MRTIVAPFRDSKVGGVTCLYRGLTDGSLAADLEAIGNSTDFAAGVLVAWLFGDVNFMLGAMMATTKKHLAEIGGFEVSSRLFLGRLRTGEPHRCARASRGAEPFSGGDCLSAADVGRRVSASVALEFEYSLFAAAGHLGLIFTQGLPWALLAAVFAPSAAWAVALMLGYLVLRGASAWIIGVWGMGDGLLRGKMELLPLRDLFAFVVWVVSFFPQRIHWRGKKFYVREKRLVAVGTRED